MSSLAHRALGGAAATLVGQAARLAVHLVSFVVLARLLAPADFGLVAMVTAITGIGELLRDFGLSVASIQAKELSAAERSNLFWLNTMVGAVLTVAAFAASWPIASLYDDERLVAVTQVIALTLLVNGVAAQFKAQINRDLRFTVLGVTDVVPQVVGVVAAIAVAVATGSYWALVVQAVVAAAVGALLCCALARWRPGRYRRDVPVGRFVRFGGALAGTQGLAYVSKNVDTVLVGAVAGPAALGVYSRAYQLVVLPLNQIAAPLSRVAIPVLARLDHTDRAYLRYLTTAQFATVATTSICFGTAIGLGGPLVRIVLGDDWADVVPILQVLAVSGIFRSLGQVSYWLFVSSGRTGSQLRLYLVGQPVIIAAIVIGATRGTMGVAIGCSVGYAAFWAINVWWAARVTPFPVGRLASSGLAIVTTFAVPVAVTGAIAVRLTQSDGAALVLGGGAATAWTAAAVIGIPRYRAEVVRLVHLARRRGGTAAPAHAAAAEP